MARSNAPEETQDPAPPVPFAGGSYCYDPISRSHTRVDSVDVTEPDPRPATQAPSSEE